MKDILERTTKLKYRQAENVARWGIGKEDPRINVVEVNLQHAGQMSTNWIATAQDKNKGENLRVYDDHGKI